MLTLPQLFQEPQPAGRITIIEMSHSWVKWIISSRMTIVEKEGVKPATASPPTPMECFAWIPEILSVMENPKEKKGNLKKNHLAATVPPRRRHCSPEFEISSDLRSSGKTPWLWFWWGQRYHCNRDYHLHLKVIIVFIAEVTSIWFNFYTPTVFKESFLSLSLSF